LLAAQTDFSEAGELTLFISESQVAYLEDIMWEQGYLGAGQMAGAFRILRSNDLIWSRVIRDYLMGDRQPISDMMAWNADATRMPYRMQSEYLRKMFLSNDLAEGRFELGGRPVALTPGSDLRRRHGDRSRCAVALRLQAQSHHGHGAYVFAHQWRPQRGHHLGAWTCKPALSRHDPRGCRSACRFGDMAETDACEGGSWWPEWSRWLEARSGLPSELPTMGAAQRGLATLADAPGTYVLQG
jgi:polyhydroxyalkanoate synthase